MNIVGKKVTLRAIERDDLATLHRWTNDPKLRELLVGWHFPRSFSELERWYDNSYMDQNNQRLAIQAPEHGLIGTANLVDIDWKNGHAFHGMLLGDKDIRGQGYGVDTIMAVMRYAFHDLRLERLDGSMIESNAISLKVYLEKCGWKQEGRLRRWFFRNGRYWDKITVGVTREDYEALLQANSYWDSSC